MLFQENTYRVLLVSSAGGFSEAMSPLLPPTDFYPVETASSVAEAQRKISESSYDLVAINAPLRDDFGTQLAISICADSCASVLLLVKNELYAEVEARVVTAGVLTLSKPTGSAQLNRALRMLCATRERLRQMEQRQLTVEKKMEQIRIVNRAKLLLMQCLSMTETDAHRYIEKQAMNLRLSKSQVAQNIIRTYGGNLD